MVSDYELFRSMKEDFENGMELGAIRDKLVQEGYEPVYLEKVLDRYLLNEHHSALYIAPRYVYFLLAAECVALFVSLIFYAGSFADLFFLLLLFDISVVVQTVAVKVTYALTTLEQRHINQCLPLGIVLAFVGLGGAFLPMATIIAVLLISSVAFSARELGWQALAAVTVLEATVFLMSLPVRIPLILSGL